MNTNTLLIVGGGLVLYLLLSKKAAPQNTYVAPQPVAPSIQPQNGQGSGAGIASIISSVGTAVAGIYNAVNQPSPDQSTDSV